MSKLKVPLLGRLAVHNKLLTPDQLEEALREQGELGGTANLGEILVAKGYLTKRKLEALVRAQGELVARERARRAAELGAAAAPEPEAEGPGPEAVAAPGEPQASALTPAAKRAAVAAPAASSPCEGAGGEGLLALLRDAVARGASDVHIHAGAPLRVRIHGSLQADAGAPLDAAAAERLALAALDPQQRAELAERGEVDLCFALPGVGRFRTNVYRQQRGLDAVFHCIPLEPPDLEDLGLPASLARFTTYHQGMVLVTGPAGCGKSSTLAALVDLINEGRREHVITIEDPVEYVHVSKRCIVNQRSVKRHTGSFARALRAAMREDPDVIVIGELRDLETISLALTAAETGHCVLATLHTDGAIRTVNRMIGVFPSDQQAQVRTMLSESLRAVVTQRLLPTADGQGRVPALETLVVNRAVANLIRENKTFQIHSVLQTGAGQGMRLLDHSLRELVQSGAVDRETALRYCEDPKALGG
jgi:twitching motility protein PilT